MNYLLVDSPNPYTAQGTYPRRGGFKPSGTIIVHTSEGAWTAGVDSLTNLVRSRTDYGCYHRACDWQDIATYYPWEWECWQDSETNNWAVGIAAACRTTDWGNMPADVEEGYYRNLARMAADFVAYMRDEYSVTVPLRRITGAEARARVPGFAAHGDSGVSRSDPGVNFDWARFFNYTAQALTGSLSYASESINLEDDMGILDEEITRTGGGPLDGKPTTLRAVIANFDANVHYTREAIKGTVAATVSALFNTEIARAGGRAGVTTLASTLAYLDANLDSLSDQELMDPEAIKAAVAGATRESLKDITLTLSTAPGAQEVTK